MSTVRAKLHWHRAGKRWQDGARSLQGRMGSDVIGAYLLYRQTPKGVMVVKVGEGHIPARLRDHRKNPDLMSEGLGDGLFLAWAAIPKGHRLLRIERYLHEVYRPKRGSVHWVRALPVNLPFRKWVPFSGST